MRKSNNKMKVLLTLLISIIAIFIMFILLWLFHGGANQSAVIIEKNVQNNR